MNGMEDDADLDPVEYGMQDLEAFINEPIESNFLNVPNDNIAADAQLDINMAVGQTDCVSNGAVVMSGGVQETEITHEQSKIEAKTRNKDRIHKKRPSKKRRISENKEECLYKCEVCSKSFKSRSGLNLHKKGQHGDGFKCDVCNKRFNSFNYLNDHKRGNHGEGFKCNICSKTYKSRNGLSAHKKGLHDDGFKCDICNKIFISNSSLNNHKKGEHGDGFKCAVCGKNFNSRSKLSEHTTGMHGKGFQCDVEGCSLNFHYRSALYYHKKYEH